MIAVAGWFKLVPFLLAPLWLAAQRGRGRLQAAAAFAAVCAAVVGLVLLIGGSSGLAAMVHAMSFQFSRGSPQSLWSALGISPLQPVAQALVLGGVGYSTVRLARHGGTPRIYQLAAVSAAALIATQLAADDWSFTYIVWFTPLLGVSLLRAQVSSRVQVELHKVDPTLWTPSTSRPQPPI